MTARDLAAFLAEDFERLRAIDDGLARRCAALDGRRLFISGATGFFGKNLLALLSFLHRRGLRFEVGGLSRDPQAFFEAAPWAQGLPWLDLQRGDVREPWPAMGRFDLLLHAATDTHAGAHRDLSAVFRDLLDGTRQALDFARRAGVQRLLLTGSGAQFGALPPGAVSDDALQACDPSRPGNAYGEGKRVAELLAALHAQVHGTAVINTRCFAFVGPGLALDGHFVIGNLLRDALAGLPLRLQTAGEAVRSYLYGADLALWLLLLLLEAPAGARVNVGSDQGLRIVELARRVRALVSPDAELIIGPPQPGQERQHYLPAIDRAHALGLAVWTPLDLAIQRCAQWQRLQAG